MAVTLQFKSLSSLIAMHGYGVSVWGAVAIVVGGLTLNLVLPWREHKKLRTQERLR